MVTFEFVIVISFNIINFNERYTADNCMPTTTHYSMYWASFCRPLHADDHTLVVVVVVVLGVVVVVVVVVVVQTVGSISSKTLAYDCL